MLHCTTAYLRRFDGRFKQFLLQCTNSPSNLSRFGRILAKALIFWGLPTFLSGQTRLGFVELRARAGKGYKMAKWRRHHCMTRFVPLALAAAAAIVGVGPAHAQIGSPRYSSIVVDATTGNVLEEVNADAERHPASLAKLMTLYITFEALRDRRITLDEFVPVSRHASEMEPTKLGLLPGSRITVEQAIMGLVTRSANDAAAALAEMLGGSEGRFAQIMTLRARALGMSRTTFANASGLPDPDAWTSARDQATLARRLIDDFPGFYHYFSTPSFVFRGQTIFSHDNMLKSYPGADGLKTGYTVASGHNLVTSAVRGGHRLIGVELGCATNAERDIHMAGLLNAGFVQEGVPVSDRPVVTAAARGRFPSLISSARAAEVDQGEEDKAEDRVRPVAHLRPAIATTSRVVVEIGTYHTPSAARTAMARARHSAEGGVARMERVTVHGRAAWRVELLGLSPAAASAACSAIARHGVPCAVRQGEGRQYAAL